MNASPVSDSEAHAHNHPLFTPITKYSDEQYNRYITYTNVVLELYITYIN